MSMTPEREKELRKLASLEMQDAFAEVDRLRDFLSPGGKQEYLLLEQRDAYEKENRELREKLALAVEALGKIVDQCTCDTPEVCFDVAEAALATIRGEKC